MVKRDKKRGESLMVSVKDSQCLYELLTSACHIIEEQLTTVVMTYVGAVFKLTFCLRVHMDLD